MPMTSLAAETAVKKLAGERPGRTRAFAVACVTALGVGTLVYKLLRSQGSEAEVANGSRPARA